jgi:hypothetical protein
MAKKGSPVKTCLEGGFPQPSQTGSKGRYDSSPAPFDKPHSMGKNTPSVKMFDQTNPAVPAPTQTIGLTDRAPRPGTKQSPYGKTDT